jgi:hypothetical protein
MMLNIHPNGFLSSALVSVTGELKKSADDFKVFEKFNAAACIEAASIKTDLPELQNVSCLIDSTISSENGSSSFVAEDYIRSEGTEEDLNMLNDWLLGNRTSPLANVDLRAPSDKEHRMSLYTYLKLNFPFIAAANAEIDGNRIIRVFENRSLLPLEALGISRDALAQIYIFLSLGPLHYNASSGINIGEGLSREQRTAVYKLFSSLCPQLDANTVDCGDGVSTVRDSF